MARVLIIGGHGKIALLLAPLLTGRDDEVTSVIRNPDHVGEVEQTGASALVADVEQLSTQELTDLVDGHDAVVWAAGAGGGDPDRTYAVDRDAAIRSIDASSAAGVPRYVMVSYIGSGHDNVPEGDSFYPYAQAKATADDHLRATALGWTVLGPGPLTLDDPTGLIEVAEPGDGRVTRADVAAVVAQCLAGDATIGRTIAFGNGDVPIAEALAA